MPITAHSPLLCAVLVALPAIAVAQAVPLVAQRKGAGPALCYPASGNIKNVASSLELTAALGSANPGDRIILASGPYAGTFALSRSGTAGSPIVITAASGSQATMTGTIELRGSYAVVTGLTFINGGVLLVDSNNRITNNVWSEFARTAVRIENNAAYNRIDHNEFGNMRAGGPGYYNAVRIAPAPKSTGTVGNRIDHNYFHDYFNGVVNGYEVITVGYAMSQVSVRTNVLIENNLFSKVNSDGEIIKNTTDGNEIVGNTFLDSRGYASNRQGRDVLWKNNYFSGVNGLRILGDDIKIIGNHFANGSLYLVAGDTTYDEIVAKLPSYPKIRPSARRALVVGNTGRLVVGYKNNGPVPVSDTIVEAHTGKIVRDLEEYTTISPTTRRDPGVAQRLSPIDVGPGSPDPSCH